MSKTANIVLKDSPAEPLLPQKLFTEPDFVSYHVALIHADRTMSCTRCLLYDVLLYFCI